MSADIFEYIPFPYDDRSEFSMMHSLATDDINLASSSAKSCAVCISRHIDGPLEYPE